MSLGKITLIIGLMITTLVHGFSINSQEEFNNYVKDALLKNPEIIIESVNQYTASQAKASQQQAEKYAQDNIAEIVGDATIPSIGAENAPITIVEFMDYQCGYCKKAHTELSSLLKSYPKEVRISIRQYPILGEQSYEAAKIALAAHSSKKFTTVHKKLFADKALSKENLAKLQKSHNLDTNNSKIDASLKKNFQLAEKLQVSVTPVFIITNSKEARIIPGYINADQLASIIKSML